MKSAKRVVLILGFIAVAVVGVLVKNYISRVLFSPEETPLAADMMAAEQARLDGRTSEAFAIYRRIADHGDYVAMWQVASMYAQGVGIEPSVKESLRWYLRMSAKFPGDMEVERKLKDFESVGLRLDSLQDQPDSLLRWLPKGL